MTSMKYKQIGFKIDMQDLQNIVDKIRPVNPPLTALANIGETGWRASRTWTLDSDELLANNCFPPFPNCTRIPSLKTERETQKSQLCTTSVDLILNSHCIRNWHCTGNK